jgi:hypothetical protein
MRLQARGSPGVVQYASRLGAGQIVEYRLLVEPLTGRATGNLLPGSWRIWVDWGPCKLAFQQMQNHLQL